jgi:CRP/FNR family transcriptional regulator, dissimilatory nitrate respiration regulator
MITIMSQELTSVLFKMSGFRREVAAQSHLFSQGDKVRSLFLVLEGVIHLERNSENGTIITLQRARPVSVISEASLYADNYHCSAICKDPTVVWVIPKADIRHHMTKDSSFAETWVKHLAREIQRTRFQAETMSLKTVAARLDAWLDWNGNTLPAKGGWKIVASQIGVSPEALYRELAKRNSG